MSHDLMLQNVAGHNVRVPNVKFSKHNVQHPKYITLQNVKGTLHKRAVCSVMFTF